MKDNLEKFIRENRSKFDHLEPRKGTWKDIRDISAKSNASYVWLWKVAAVVLFVTSVGLIYERSTVNENMEAVNVEQGNDELNQVEEYYTGLINQKKAEIILTIKEKKLTDVNLLEDLNALDQMYTDLKSELEQNTNNEKLINAMIRNLQLRVEILSKQLEILQQLEKQENEEFII
ncbi:MAG: hypothetical protein JXR07_12915 [Reichenbachiella sp.]